MLDAFIIEEIRRREQEQDKRPRLDLPLPEPTPARQNDRDEEDAPQRGVIIIDYSIPQDIPA
jgi:hypothetical protein